MSSETNILRAQLLIEAAELLAEDQLNEAASIKTHIAAKKSGLKLDAKKGTVTDPKTGLTVNLNTRKIQSTVKKGNSDSTTSSIDKDERFLTKEDRKKNKDSAHYNSKTRTITLGEDNEGAYELAHEFGHAEDRGKKGDAATKIYAYSERKFSNSNNQKTGRGVSDPRASSKYANMNQILLDRFAKQMKSKGYPDEEVNKMIRGFKVDDKTDLKRFALLINQLPVYGSSPTNHIKLEELMAEYRAAKRIGQKEFERSVEKQKEKMKKSAVKNINKNILKKMSSDLQKINNASRKMPLINEFENNEKYAKILKTSASMLKLSEDRVKSILLKKNGADELYDMAVKHNLRAADKNIREFDMRKDAIRTVRKKMNENYNNIM